MLITAKDLGLKESETAEYTWQITKGGVDYTGESIDGKPLTASEKDNFAILPVDGNCILDGATIKLFVSEELLGGGSVEAPKNVLVHVMHTPKAVMGSLTNTWYQGDEQHYHVCKSCGVEYGHEDHTSGDWIVDKEATEEDIKKIVVLDRVEKEDGESETRAFCPFCNGLLKDTLSILFVTELLKGGCTFCY